MQYTMREHKTELSRNLPLRHFLPNTQTLIDTGNSPPLLFFTRQFTRLQGVKGCPKDNSISFLFFLNFIHSTLHTVYKWCLTINRFVTGIHYNNNKTCLQASITESRVILLTLLKDGAAGQERRKGQGLRPTIWEGESLLFYDDTKDGRHWVWCNCLATHLRLFVKYRGPRGGNGREKLNNMGLSGRGNEEWGIFGSWDFCQCISWRVFCKSHVFQGLSPAY